MTINRTIQVVVGNLVDSGAAIAGDKGVTIAQPPIIRDINGAADNRAVKLGDRRRAGIKTHLDRGADGRHGIAFMTGFAGHALENTVLNMRPGTGRSGGIGC